MLAGFRLSRLAGHEQLICLGQTEAKTYKDSEVVERFKSWFVGLVWLVGIVGSSDHLHT